MDKKFKAYELLQNYLTNYSKELSNFSGLLIELQFSLNSPIRREYEASRWLNVQSEIIDAWLKTKACWVEFHRTFENYRIVLTEIEELFYKLLSKQNEFENYIQRNVTGNTIIYSDVIDNAEKRLELLNLINELSMKVLEQLVFNLDAVTGFQNNLFSGVFDRKIPKRKPQNKEYEVLE